MSYSPNKSSSTSQLIANNKFKTSNQKKEFCCITDVPIINPSNLCYWEITFSHNASSKLLVKKDV